MVDLEIHRQRGGDHGDRDHILERDEDLAEHHLRLPAERPAHHVDRFGRRDHQGRKQPRQSPRQHDKQDDRPYPKRCHQHIERQAHLQQVIGIRQCSLGQHQPDGKRNDRQEGSLQHQPEEQFHTRRTQKAACRHLLRPLAGLCHRQVDIVDDRKNQDQDADGHQDQRKTLVALVQAMHHRVSEINLRKRNDAHFLHEIHLVKPIPLLEKAQYLIRPPLQIHPRLQQ